MVYLAYRYSRVSHPVLKEVQQRVADVTTQAEENVVGVRVVKAFAQEAHETARFRGGSERIFRQAIVAARLQATYVPALSALPSLAIAGVLLVGGYQVVHGSLTLGDFFAVNAYLLLLVMPLRMIGMWVGQYQRAMASGERVFEVLDEERDVVERPDARPLPDGPGAVRFEGVGFGYDGRAAGAVGYRPRDRAGQTVALIGPTGCGKTTLTALIPRFYDVDAGPGTAGRPGRARRHARLAARRDRHRRPGHLPVLDHGRREHRLRRARRDARSRSARRPCAPRRTSSSWTCPTATRPAIGERGLTLSGGQRQRIAIARALLMDPRVLILDDATASVDANTEAKIKLALREVMRGRTTLIIAHRLSTISLADEVVVLDRGRIVARGQHAVLLEQSPVYQQIYEHGLVERTFVQLDPDGAPIEKEDVGVRATSFGSHSASGPAPERPRPARAPSAGSAQLIRYTGAATRRGRSWRSSALLGVDRHHHRRPGGRQAGDRPRHHARRLRPDRAVGGGVRGGRRSPAWRSAALQSYLTSWVGERVLTDLRVDLFSHVQQLDLGYFERTRAGVAISRLTNDIEALNTLVTDGPTTLVQNTLTLIGSAAVLLYLDWRLALATLTMFPGMTIATGALPPLLVACLPAHPRAAGRGHRQPAGGHLRRARGAGVPPRAGQLPPVRATSTAPTATPTCRRST